MVMKQKQLMQKIRLKLMKLAEADYRDGERKYFKEPVKNLGVRVPQRRQVANYFWPEVKKLSKEEIFELAESMFKNRYNDYATIASSWVYRIRKEYKIQDFKVMESWINKYLDNWAKVDDFCNHAMAALIDKYPQLLKGVKKWTRSKNRWVKRAGAVSLVIPARKGRYLKDVLEIAEKLMMDGDDMVQKGYGWMLKAASEAYQKEVFEFVVKNQSKMPRTALRYAIEKMPKKLKKKAMAVNS